MMGIPIPVELLSVKVDISNRLWSEDIQYFMLILHVLTVGSPSNLICGKTKGLHATGHYKTVITFGPHNN